MYNKLTKFFAPILCFIFMVLNLFSYPVHIFADTASALSNAEPIIQITGYEITKGNLELDSEFTIKITITNKNAYASAYNIIASAITDDVSFHLSDNQVNQNYIQSLGPNSSTSFEQTYKLEKNYPNKSIFLTYKLNYSGENGSRYENDSSISPTVNIPCKLKLSNISVSNTATLGSRSSISITLVNDGTIDITSIKMKLNGDIIDSQKNIEFGALKSGEELSKDCYVNYLKENDKGIGISFEYKDESGNAYTIPESTYPVIVTSAGSSVNTDSEIGAHTINLFGIKISIISFLIILIIVIISVFIIIKLYNNVKKGMKR